MSSRRGDRFKALQSPHRRTNQRLWVLEGEDIWVGRTISGGYKVVGRSRYATVPARYGLFYGTETECEKVMLQLIAEKAKQDGC